MQLHIKNPRLVKSALYASMITSVTVIIAKIYGFFITDSVAILASLVDSFFDAFSSFFNLFAAHLSQQPPDNKHRFGKDKIEDLAIFAQSMLFFASGIFALSSSIQHAIQPHAANENSIGIDIMLLALLLNAALVTYQSIVVSKTQSRIVAADRLHYFSDFISGAIVIISLYLSNYHYWIDSIFGALIACYIIYNSYTLFIQSTKNLIDQEFNENEKAKIMSLLGMYNADVHAVHELKTRYAGTKPFIQFHLEMKRDMSLSAAHDISERISMDLKKLFVGAEITIHQDPPGIEEDAEYREIL